MGGLEPDVALDVESEVEATLSSYPRLRRNDGRNVLELLPDADWHKGKAVLRILETLENPVADVFPIYIGDDRADEHAFSVLSGSRRGYSGSRITPLYCCQLLAERPCRSA